MESFSKGNKESHIISGHDFERKYDLMLRALRVSKSLATVASSHIPSEAVRQLTERVDNAFNVLSQTSLCTLERAAGVSSTAIRHFFKECADFPQEDIMDNPIVKQLIPVSLTRYILQQGLYR